MGNQEDKKAAKAIIRGFQTHRRMHMGMSHPKVILKRKTDMAVLLYVCIYMQSRFALELLRGDMYECVYSDASRPSTCLKLITNMIILTKAKCRLKYPTVFAEAEGLFPLCGLGAGG